MGKTPRLGASSPSSSAKIRVKGQALSPLAKVPRVIGPQHRSSPTAAAKGPLRRAADSPLEVMPISVWNPLAESTKFPPSMPEVVRRDRVGAERD